MKKLMIVALFGLMACNSSPTHSSKHSYDLTNRDVIPGRIVVDLKDNVSDNDIKELSKIAHTRLHADNDVARKFKIEVGQVDVADEEAILDALNNDSRVEHAEPDFKLHALFTPNDPMLDDQWGLTRVGSESAWNMSCGSNIRIAIVDTGVDTRMSDLANTKFSEGYNFISNDVDTIDDQGHGTHVAGSVAQSTNNDHGGAGVAYCATLIPVKVLDAGGSGSLESVSEGIRFAADQGANIINLSLGASRGSGVLEDAINYAHDKGTLPICAAGNDGSSVNYPGAYKNCMAISALDKNDHITDFSSRGSEIAVISPGRDVLQQTICDKPEGCFKKFSGTSMATPICVGAAGVAMSMGITDPDAVRAKLMDTAEDLGMDADEQGTGVVRADKAARSVVFNHTLWRLIGLAGILFFLRKKINMVAVKSKMAIAGTVFAGFGILPIFFLSILPRLGSFRIFAELAARPFAEWNLPLGFMVHYLPFANFLPAGLAVLLMLNSKLKNFAGGVALGSAALLAQMFWSADMFYFAGSLIMRVMLGASVGVCIYLAKTVFEKKA